MGYLSNRTINYLNLLGALLSLLEQGWSLFGPLYLYSRGFSVAEVFMLMAVLIGSRIPLRLLTFPIVHKFGLRAALMLGTAGYACTFPILAMVKGYDYWLLAYVLMFGIFCAMYWHCYHTFYSLAGEHEHRGKQLSVAQAMSVTFSAVVPLLSAFFITSNGYEKYFWMSLPVLMAMIYVISRCENIPTIPIKWKDGKKLMFNLGAKIHIAEASATFPVNIGWIFVTYFYVKKLVIFGVVLTFGILVQIIYQLWIGKAIDRGRGHFVANAAGFLRALQVLGKALLPLSYFSLFSLEALTGATNVHHALAQPTVMYNTGKKSADPFWYWFFAETAYDLGTILGSGGAALCLFYGLPVRLVILLALPGVFAVWRLTYKNLKPKKA